MKLSDFERLTLIAQYEILEFLEKDKEEKKRYQKYLEILHGGFEYHYKDLQFIPRGYDPTTEKESLEVLEILDMFRVIANTIESGVDASGIDESSLRFNGFDTSIDYKQLQYLQFYCALISEAYNDIVKDSDGEVLISESSRFWINRSMFKEWKKSKSPYNLKRKDLERISKVYFKELNKQQS